MSEQITPEVFNHLVELAALELTPDEAEYLRRQLNNQLTAIDDLNQVPLDPETPVASHVAFPTPRPPPLRFAPTSGIRTPTRPSCSKARPKSTDGYIVVPEIPHQDLD
jgi:aspartyl-tRNA(Asn)/glutamyl-tRNA(Gln) amidotransferase subunit C